MKKPFLERPQVWTQAARMSQHPVEYASAIERYHSSNGGKGTKALAALAATFAVAAVLVLCIVFFTQGVK